MTPTQITHPESAWIADAAPLALAVAAVLALSLLLRGRMRATLLGLLQRRAARSLTAPIEPALVWTPPIVSEGRLLTVCLLAALALLLLLSLLAPVFVAVLLAGPATAMVIWLLLWAEEQRYVTALDRALPAAVGRLAAQLRSGSGIQPALERVVGDLADGPLKAEWQFVITHFGAPLGGALATPQQVVAALATQTPSRRHAALLGHMEVALGQTHDVLVKRLQAAYAALLAAEQRRSQAATELAQMRYSGIAIGLAGMGMAAYLALTQWQRFTLAYQGPLGLVAGLVVGTVLLAPFVGGFLLARAGDLDY